MSHNRAHTLLIAITLATLTPLAAHAAFPTKTFAPYLEIDAGDSDTSKLTSMQTTTGSGYYTLAFANENTAGTNVIWGDGGSVSATGSNPAYLSQVNALRAAGGDVIFSFGGAGSSEPADAPGMTVTTLQAQYQAVVSAYHATWLDFDIEGAPLDNVAANTMRNTALKALQLANPGLQISFTLAADPSGLDKNGLTLLENAASQKLQVRTVNAMTMDFGTGETNGTTVSAVAISTATAVHKELMKNIPATNFPIGMTCLIGQSDNVGEVFQMSDAAPFYNFAKTTSWINELSMWSIDRDNGTKINTIDQNTSSGIVQPTFFFTDTFKAFNGAPEPTSLALLTPAALLLLRRRPRNTAW